jgi:hypothetical protein
MAARLVDGLADAMAGLSLSYRIGRTPWAGDRSITRPLPTHRTTQIQNKHTQTSMPRVALEHTISEFERAKTVLALDHTATLIGFTTPIFLIKEMIAAQMIYIFTDVVREKFFTGIADTWVKSTTC